VSLSGDLIWEQTYATSPNSDEIGYGIATAVNGGFVIAGRTFVANQSIVQGLLMKIEENGAATPAWTQFFFPVAQQLNDVTNDGDGGYIVCGKTYEVGGAGVQNETFLARVNSVGTTQWVTLAGKAGLSEGYAVAQAPNGGFVEWVTLRPVPIPCRHPPMRTWCAQMLTVLSLPTTLKVLFFTIRTRIVPYNPMNRP
jgi:hypothetical protein